MDGTGTYEAESQVCRVTSCSGPPEPVVTEAPAFTCSTVGLFADPADCHSFYSCGEDLQAVPGTCLKGQGKFDAVNRVCTADTCSNPFKCTSTGFFADPNDCHGFYVCDENLTAVQSTCTTLAHFDPQRICAVGPCVQASTTTSAPNTQSHSPFKCTAQGYFADPDDCHSYYMCDSGLNAVHSVCMGGGGYYDPEEEGCYSGSC
jgi:hypothetical protein